MATKEIKMILLICANVLAMHPVTSGNVSVAIRQAARFHHHFRASNGVFFSNLSIIARHADVDRGVGHIDSRGAQNVWFVQLNIA